MKPKHRVYCRDCGRRKMLFESEKKALTFIKFNGDAVMANRRVNQKAPVRAYYCECCGGWHVTSKAVEDVDADLLNRTENIVDAYRTDLRVNMRANCGEKDALDVPARARSFVCQYNRVKIQDMDDFKRARVAVCAAGEGRALLSEPEMARYCERADVAGKVDELCRAAVDCSVDYAETVRNGGGDSSKLGTLAAFAAKKAGAYGRRRAALIAAGSCDAELKAAAETPAQTAASKLFSQAESEIRSMEANIAVGCPGGALERVPRVVEILTGLSRMDRVDSVEVVKLIDAAMALRDKAARMAERHAVN